ncbi:MAG: pantoate--beta-alanine ligase, partial [Acidobacteria bacterium]|nr:pantoate--beta-alanine ligase [Acidobacteriota bacterium]
HFRGVTTVVTKLFHIVEPDLAFFGQKDAAQVAIIGRLVRDLQMAVEIVVCPIVRDPDGLAMSSRNTYLHPRQRKRALLLFRALDRVQQVFAQGETHAGKLIEAGKQVIAEEPSVQLDYLEIVNPETLDTLEIVSSSALVAGAVVVGTTRLIDNIVLARSG